MAGSIPTTQGMPEKGVSSIICVLHRQSCGGETPPVRCGLSAVNVSPLAPRVDVNLRSEPATVAARYQPKGPAMNPHSLFFPGGILSRRDLFRLGGLGIGATLLPGTAAVLPAETNRGTARSVIFMWLA